MGGWLVDSDFFSSSSSHLPPPPPFVTEEWFSSTYITCQLARCQRKQRVMSFRYRFRFIPFFQSFYFLFLFFSVLYGTVIHEPIVFLSVLDFSCLISFTFLFSMYAYKKSCCICLFVQGENYSVFFFYHETASSLHLLFSILLDTVRVACVWASIFRFLFLPWICIHPSFHFAVWLPCHPCKVVAPNRVTCHLSPFFAAVDLFFLVWFIWLRILD